MQYVVFSTVAELCVDVLTLVVKVTGQTPRSADGDVTIGNHHAEQVAPPRVHVGTDVIPVDKKITLERVIFGLHIFIKYW